MQKIYILLLCSIWMMTSTSLAWGGGEHLSVHAKKQKAVPHFSEPAWWIEGAGAVTLVGGIVTLALGYGVLAQHDMTRSTLLRKTPKITPEKQRELAAEKQRGESITTVGWVVFSVSVVAIVVGATWLIADTQRRVPPPKSGIQWSKGAISEPRIKPVASAHILLRSSF